MKNNNKVLSDKVLKKVLDEDSKAFGNLKVEIKGNIYFVTGSIYSSIENINDFIVSIIVDENPTAVVYVYLNTSESKLSVQTYSNNDADTVKWGKDGTPNILDEVKVLYYGFMKTSNIKRHEKYKVLNFETLQNIKNIVTVLKFINPIVLDHNLRIIDGNLRHEIAENLEIEEVPVIIIDANDVKADFLRLALNRVSEFQRWEYNDVDEYVDKTPQVQPLLEPIGFFSNNILPTSFFGNTVIAYELDEFNKQMSMYSQDIGLAKWAEMRRAEILEGEERRKKKYKAKPDTSNKTSLFDLIADEEDFIPTSDVESIVKDHVKEMKVVAEGITNEYDRIRKAEKEAKGQAWQTTRRTSRQLAADERAKAEAEAKAKIEDENESDEKDE